MSLRKRFLNLKIYNIDNTYEDLEVNDFFTLLEVTIYEDTNKDTLPDHVIVMETCSSNHEKLNFPIHNLIIGQEYILTFDEWSNATRNIYYTSDWMYGCSLSETLIISGSPGKKLFTKFPIWDCSDSIGGLHSGLLIFTATAETMYWVWDFGAIEDGISFRHLVTNINLLLVAPVFNFKTVNHALGNGTYEYLSSSENSVNFNFKGSSGVEVFYYKISNLVKGLNYRLTFTENYHGQLLEDKYYYGCNISGSPISSMPSVNFTEVNNQGSRKGIIEFNPSEDVAYWVWNLGRCQDGVTNNITFTIELEIEQPDGTYKKLI